MGFDLYGKHPSKKFGQYFRNNCWWWRPLWQYVCDNCADILTEEDMTRGCYNDGWLIDEKKALSLYQRLYALVKDGNAKQYEEAYNKRIKEIPDEPCEYCNETGQRIWPDKVSVCNVCEGKGKKRPFETSYPFSADNVREFALFCKASKGFEIC